MSYEHEATLSLEVDSTVYETPIANPKPVEPRPKKDDYERAELMLAGMAIEPRGYDRARERAARFFSRLRNSLASQDQKAQLQESYCTGYNAGYSKGRRKQRLPEDVRKSAHALGYSQGKSAERTRYARELERLRDDSAAFQAGLREGRQQTDGYKLGYRAGYYRAGRTEQEAEPCGSS